MTGLTNGVTYIFQLRAWASDVGGAFGGLQSEERSATPMAPPELTFGSTTYSGGEGSGTISVTVNASSAPTSVLTVNLTSTNGTATGGTDFIAPQATFTFPASMTSHTISVAITQDTTVESDETFTLALTADCWLHSRVAGVHDGDYHQRRHGAAARQRHARAGADAFGTVCGRGR